MSKQLPVILVVDDDAALQEYTIEALRQLGYIAIGVADVPAALGAVHMLPSLRVVLSDIQLKSCAGSDMVRQALRSRPDLKVVFMSDGTCAAECRHTDRVLAKPVALQELEVVIDDVLHGTPHVAESLPSAQEQRRVVPTA
jgi:DNA-binding NtrC family response regulator